jgi:hypothetical protein
LPEKLVRQKRQSKQRNWWKEGFSFFLLYFQEKEKRKEKEKLYFHVIFLSLNPTDDDKSTY